MNVNVQFMITVHQIITLINYYEFDHDFFSRYTCQYCSKSYLRPEHLREHVEIVHKNQKLACPYDNCEARFTQRPSLITHVKKHQEDPQSLELSRYRYNYILAQINTITVVEFKAK